MGQAMVFIHLCPTSEKMYLIHRKLLGKLLEDVHHQNERINQERRCESHKGVATQERDGRNSQGDGEARPAE